MKIRKFSLFLLFVIISLIVAHNVAHSLLNKNIGYGNGMAPVTCPAVIWTNAHLLTI